ncbi:10747_t:CDS:2 [Funneliformis mosseae]|uniref:10747_t:CDS:1 n=1 Tax=Funneliformis mosseae TaxID=27381 RepID=A0A9N8V315_FUNMO|nr:10747_t:CDS:2 [Funneliformis mosseae]
MFSEFIVSLYDFSRKRKREEKLQRESTVTNSSYNSEKDNQVILKILREFEKTISSGNDQNHVTSSESDLLSVKQDDDMIQEASLDKNQIIE